MSRKSSTILIIFIFLLSPLLAVFLLATSSSPVMVISLENGLSLRWFFELISDPHWLHATLWSLSIAMTTSVVAVLIGTPAAFACVRARGRTTPVIFLLLIAPLFIPPIVLAIGLYFMLDRFSLFDSFLGIVLAHQAAAMPAAFLILQARFREGTFILYDTARLLGASAQRAAFTWLWNAHRGTLVAAIAVAILISYNEAIITIFVTDTHIKTVSRQALSGIARDIRPVGFAFLVVWWVTLTAMYLSYRRWLSKL